MSKIVDRMLMRMATDHSAEELRNDNNKLRKIEDAIASVVYDAVVKADEKFHTNYAASILYTDDLTLNFGVELGIGDNQIRISALLHKDKDVLDIFMPTGTDDDAEDKFIMNEVNMNIDKIPYVSEYGVAVNVEV